jgi:glycerophosphoryl diester phosphodiesterase
MSPPGRAPATPEIIGHRGYSARYPENTLPALEGALAAGCRSLEWDVHVSADGVPVLFHDDTLERTTDGAGLLHDQPLGRLRKLDAGAWFDPRFQGTRIPTLEEALEALEGRVDRIYPEVKRAGGDQGLEAIVRLLRDSPLHSRTILISMDLELLPRVRRRDPELTLGWVVSRPEDLEPSARAVLADGNAVLDPDRRLLLADPERTRELVTRGVPLVTWTVDDVDEAEALREMGVHRITTNRVGELMAWSAS